MKIHHWLFRCFFVFSILNAVPLTVASADLPLESATQKLLGEWQVGFDPRLFESGLKPSLRKHFLTGEVGPVWKFNEDGSAIAHIPCNINERLKKGVLASGTWKLSNDGSTFNLHVRMALAAQLSTEAEQHIELRGPLIFGVIQSKNVESTTMTVGNRRFGRYNDSVFTCD